MTLTRSTAMGLNGAISTPHYLASAAGLRVLQDGGNALDACVAACAVLGGYALVRLRWRGAGLMGTAVLVSYLLPTALMFIPLYAILASLKLIERDFTRIMDKFIAVTSLLGGSGEVR